MSLIVFIVFLLVVAPLVPNTNSDVSAASFTSVVLTPDEQEYLNQLGPVKMAVDPDWEPYELINDKGEFVGIAADLIRLIAQRANITLELVPTTNWTQTLEYSQNGLCHIIPFLTRTPSRDAWLYFTDPYFIDPVVFIARNEHDFITNPSALDGETVVLPVGTSIEERLRNDYPNLIIVTVESEREAFQMVEDKEADLTLRSLTMAAYTIKKEGWFNLKIAGQYPDYDNLFRVGVVHDQAILAAILNKSIATLTPQEVQAIVNQHISIEFVTGQTDYGPLAIMLILSSMLIMFVLVHSQQLKRFNKELQQREDDLEDLARQLREENIKLERLSRSMGMANNKLKILTSITRHDILNQVMVFQGFLELLTGMSLDEKQQRYLHRMQGAADNIQRQIEFTREYDQLGSEEPIWYNVSSISQDIVGGKIPLRVDCDASIQADMMVGKVFYNLYDNTLRHAIGATGIHVHCRKDGEDLLIIWEDDGPGVDRDMKERIFQRGVGANTGLGLFLIREILTITGIEIIEDGEPGKGARFVMRIPEGGYRLENSSIG